MVVALKDFRYYDFARRESIPVRAGQSVDEQHLARNNVNLDRLLRTKHLAVAESGERLQRPPRATGRVRVPKGRRKHSS